MKKLILSSIVAIALLASCGDGAKSKSDSVQATAPANGNSNIAAVKYQCPMKCEGEKTYDAAGKCPMCQMDMKEVK
jgi:hypothetical protein